ncbi:MAG: ABC transporter substrate-binding protein [Verrucomicrobia bacterium]|nr:ABC transporter substrate-binding protein [Verrucomicrobiota bacterium]
MSGPSEYRGKEALDAVHLYFDEVNRQGGVRDHPLEVIPYDDADKPVIASEKAREVAASQALVVIGHFTSPASLAGGKIYREASIPAITAFATVPGVTAGNPYYFRLAIESSAQGHFLAAYAKNVLGQRRARVIFSDEAYGRSLRAAFADEFVEEGGEMEGEWAWDPDGPVEQHAAVIEQASTNIANGESGVLVLAVGTDLTKEVVLRLRRTGVNPVILGGSSLGSDFPQRFRDEPEEQREPGYFTNNTYLAAPLLLDSSSERSLEFSEQLFNRYGLRADEVSAKYYDAALLIVEALRSGQVQLTSQSRDADRRTIREWLARQVNPSQAITGLTGPMYFDQNQSAILNVRIGRCTEGQCVSAPIQLAAVPDPRLIDLDRELAAGHVIRVRQQFYWLQRVVYTGIDINQISRVDTSKGTFSSDFYLWFRYAGDDEVRSVDLNAATEKSPYDEKSPLLEQKLNGLHYSLYRIRGDFRSTFDFHDYPFDSQSLVLSITNPRMTREQVIYAIDTFGLKLPRAGGGVSQLPGLANWDFTHVLYGSDTLSSHSTRGQPSAFRTNNETQFSGFNVTIGIKRKTLVFLIKTLLPLLLLVLVVYVTLFFPPSLTKERLTIAISAMLASAVLLTAINSQLTDVGYTTAIEYGFYAFFALCLFCVIAGLMTERLHTRKNPNLANRFDLASRIIYPLAAVTVFVCYYFRYH